MTQPLFDETATCDLCGRHGAYQFDGKARCDDCYASSGSCCAGIESAPTDVAADRAPTIAKPDCRGG